MTARSPDAPPLSSTDEKKVRQMNQQMDGRQGSIADATVIKDEDLFFLCHPNGTVPLDGHHGFGLYHRDCRFLNGYEIRLNGQLPRSLISSANRGYMAVFEVTNPEISSGDERLPKQTIAGKYERIIDGKNRALHDLLTFRNFGHEAHTLTVSFTFSSAFEDIFVVRGMQQEKRGTLHPPAWEGDVLRFAYDGADGLHRELAIRFGGQEISHAGNRASFSVTLPPRKEASFEVAMTVLESEKADRLDAPAELRSRQGPLHEEMRRAHSAWLERYADVDTDSLLLKETLARSLNDLRVLRSRMDGHEFFAAGVPWYATLFGRDSLISALQTLAFNPDIAEGTLRTLAAHQGTKVDEWRDEEPGKIPHEFRMGEMARLNEVPFTPYYGTVDATLLFLILLARHARWTGDLALFKALRPNVERAFEWVRKYGEMDRDGYVKYRNKSKRGLANQGWKDSGDSIVNVDGTLAEPPIALAEVQGYVYAAKTEIADLYERAGNSATAQTLRGEADALKARFNRDFWIADRSYLAMALQSGNRPVSSIASNPGQALWSGIVDAEKAALIADRLLKEDMFSGWGIRTLSTDEIAFNPEGYHVGSVWPHDNSLIAAGLRRYGHDEAMERVFTGICEAAMYFGHRRLPEVFAGFSRAEYDVPVHYPVACHPQAWSAGSVPYLLTAALGLEPNAFERSLHIRRPLLPPFAHSVVLRHLRVGDAHADLNFRQDDDGAVSVRVLKIDGDLDVEVSPAPMRRRPRTLDPAR